jgi:hypothetical protein
VPGKGEVVSAEPRYRALRGAVSVSKEGHIVVVEVVAAAEVLLQGAERILAASRSRLTCGAVLLVSRGVLEVSPSQLGLL